MVSLSILSVVTTVITMKFRNGIKNEYKTIDERIGYLKALEIKGEMASPVDRLIR